MLQQHLAVMKCVVNNMVESEDKQAGDLKEVSNGGGGWKASQPVAFILTPPPVHPAVIVAAWFTDIICIAKSTPLMCSAADAGALSLLPSAVF